jgi:DNA-binding NarL/FixJ family response regulator
MKVLVVDDHDLLRESLAAALGTHGVDVVGNAGDADSAIAAVDRLAPDVVVLDVQLGPAASDVGGFTVAQHIRATRPETGLLMLSIHDEPAYLQRLLDLDAGGPRAAGYLVKDRGGLDALVAALGRVAAGEVVLDPLLVRRLTRRRAELTSLLTPLEHQTLSLAAEGYSNQGIAERTGRSRGTIEQQLNTVIGKLGLPAMDDPQRRQVNIRVLAVLAYLGVNSTAPGPTTPERRGKR